MNQHWTRRFWLLALSALGLALMSQGCGAAATPTWDQLQAFYAYDPTQPLEAKAEEPQDRGLMTAQTIHFGSINGQRVPALLCRPKSPAKPKVILALHGLGGDRNQGTMLLAPLVCPLGIAVMSIDAPFHGERKVEGKQVFSSDPVATGAAFRQAIVDNRRAIDYLKTRDDLDTDHLVLVGMSLGSIMGTIVTAVDQRIAAPWLIVGGGNLPEMFNRSQIGLVKKLRSEMGDLERFADQFPYIDPVSFSGHISPRPLLMLNGRTDQIIPSVCSEALFAAARDPKTIVWYDGGSGEGHIPPLKVFYEQLRAFLEAEGLVGR